MKEAKRLKDYFYSLFVKLSKNVQAKNQLNSFSLSEVIINKNLQDFLNNFERNILKVNLFNKAARGCGYSINIIFLVSTNEPAFN